MPSRWLSRQLRSPGVLWLYTCSLWVYGPLMVYPFVGAPAVLGMGALRVALVRKLGGGGDPMARALEVSALGAMLAPAAGYFIAGSCLHNMDGGHCGLMAGAPVTAYPIDGNDNPSWPVLAAALAPLALPAAQVVVERLDVSRRGALSIVDVGGGSGSFSAVLLGANRLAEARQVDWPAVNALARGSMTKLGLGQRFHTVDGDLHTADWGTGHDIGIYSNVAHFQSPARNIAALRKFRRALKATGTLVISEYVTKADRDGQHFALLLSGQMLLTSTEGGAWRLDDYRKWLADAGFSQVTFAETAGPSILILATP